MPLPSDEKIVQLAEQLIQQLDTIFGLHPGFRPAHAKGLLLNGTFTPSASAQKLTRAPHIARNSTPVIGRFSNSTGIPLLPDNDPNADPRGLAIRFMLGEHVHTDIVSHATDGFPTRTGGEFLEFLKALAGGTIEQYLGTHPAALAFVQAPKPAPVSFATEPYFGVTAFKFTNSDGVGRFGRYRIVPEAGVNHLSADDVQKQDPNYLFEEIKQRVGASPVRFRILVQLANEGDVVDDATVHWPEDRETVELGSFALAEVVPENEQQQKRIIFDPIPRVDGIEASGDPLLELRAAVYLLTGRRRRSA